MSILFKFFGAFFIFLFLGGGLSLIFGKVFEDNDDFGGCWIASVLFYTLIIMGIMGHFGYFNS